MEMGWTTDSRPNSPYNWHAVTPEQQAEYLVKAMQYAKANWPQWAGPMVVLYIPEPEWTANDEQYYWSITNPDGTARPAYGALKALLPGSMPTARRARRVGVAIAVALIVAPPDRPARAPAWLSAAPSSMARRGLLLVGGPGGRPGTIRGESGRPVEAGRPTSGGERHPT